MHNLTRNFFPGLLIFATSATVFGLDQPLVPPAPVNVAHTNGLGPKIEFATPVYEFGRVKNSELVKYSFVFTNTGDQQLIVTAVQPSCGCTTAGDWSRKVMPGQTGIVPIQFNSANFNGPVFKTISVSSNDKQRPVTVLQLKGTIWKPIEFFPLNCVLNVPPDAQSASTSIRIINNTDEPLTFSPPECSHPSFQVTLSTNRPGKEFQLTLASGTVLTGGNVQGKITLKTSSTNTPTLDIPFWVNVQPALSVMPRQIMLPHAPLTAKTPSTVTIRNNSTNALSLTDLAVNVPGVDVQLQVVQAGKVYSAQLTFPEGFEIPTGQSVVLSMKSSHPQMPEVRVPVFQSPRPTTGAPPVPKPAAPATGAPVAKPAASAQATH